MSRPEPAMVFTIGHSNHELEALVGLLRRHEVTVVADVRSEPYSRYCPQFNAEVLRAALPEHGLGYEFLGRELGARRSERECYVDGVARYALIAQTPAFAAGLARVRELSTTQRVALLCAEKDPLQCHRTILVSRALAGRGFTGQKVTGQRPVPQAQSQEMNIQHILEDGSLEALAAAEERLMRLFGLEGPHLFQSREELLAEAYARQAERIQYSEAQGAGTEQPV